MNAEQRARELAEDKLADREDLFVVDVKMHGGGKLEILLDGDRGIGIQECAAVSRHVGFHLEEENVLEQAYHLEVSSAGVGTPLKLQRQYPKNIGRTLQVKGTDGTEQEGILLQTDENGILLEVKTRAEKGKKPVIQEQYLLFTAIKEAVVTISFK